MKNKIIIITIIIAAVILILGGKLINAWVFNESTRSILDAGWNFKSCEIRGDGVYNCK